MLTIIKRPFQYLRIYKTFQLLTLKLKELSKAKNMNLRLSLIASIVAIGIQLLVQISPLVPDEFKHITLSGHILLEALAKVLAFYTNPDGTNARVSWTPEVKK